MKDVYKDEDKFHEYMEAKYPKIFSEGYGGFAVGPGWYPILDALCNQIQAHINWKNKDIEMTEGVPQVVVSQIKEKYGGLRFYHSGGDDCVDGMVRMAESWAENTCETCGAPGEARTPGWIKTLCDEHAKAK
jgi:hypothetical protein